MCLGLAIVSFDSAFLEAIGPQLVTFPLTHSVIQLTFFQNFNSNTISLTYQHHQQQYHHEQHQPQQQYLKHHQQQEHH